jgi:hypothetical protein
MITIFRKCPQRESIPKKCIVQHAILQNGSDEFLPQISSKKIDYVLNIFHSF